MLQATKVPAVDRLQSLSDRPFVSKMQLHLIPISALQKFVLVLATDEDGVLGSTCHRR